FSSVPTSTTCRAKNWLLSSPPACSKHGDKPLRKLALCMTSSATTLHSSMSMKSGCYRWRERTVSSHAGTTRRTP
ncbi:hypothetical protein NQZ68_012006, partial [Dissostichus eleginoides]